MDFNLVLLLKILVTLLVVVGLSLIAERVSTGLAGVLAGFPHGVAIVLYFIGLEQGADFAAQASLYTVGGIAANVVLLYSYYLLCFKLSWNNPLIVAIGSILAFLSAAFLMQFIANNQIMAVIVTVSIIALSALLLRQAKDISIKNPVKISQKDILFRALLAASIVLIITELADIVGPNWAGLLAGFPVVALPLILIIHYKYGKQPLSSMIKNYPFGLLSLVVYVVTVSFAFPAFGINIGTLIGLFSALVYLAGMSFYRYKKGG